MLYFKSVQCFDLNGNFLQHALDNEVGPIYAVSFASSNASILYAVNGYNSRGEGSQFDKKIYLISTKTGNPVGAINLAPEIRTPHDIALADDASEIYIANLNPAGVYKYSLVNFNCKKIDRSFIYFHLFFFFLLSNYFLICVKYFVIQ